ncbi:MAG: hypothetical protein WKF73_05110 [Nocardioidaceae bacterium]
MIIRILSEGQFDVPDSEVDKLNELDSALESAIDSGDDDAFRDALAQLLGRVRKPVKRWHSMHWSRLIWCCLTLPRPWLRFGTCSKTTG